MEHRRRRRWRRAVAASLAAAVLGLLVLVAYGLLRPHAAYPPGEPPGLETWAAVADGRHNSNTDLIRWHDAFWLVHASAPWHFKSTRTRLVLRTSTDARSWQEAASFAVPGEDVRDPKLAVLGDRLFLYFLPNRHFPEPQPYTTLVTSSVDGRGWDPPEAVTPRGWLLWRPKTRDGATWYATAYWHEHGRAALLRSTDGRHFEPVSQIVEGDSADETAFEFLDDGRILATSRLEGENHDSWFGDPAGGTLLSVAAPPYTDWSRHRDGLARLDGPCLFRYEGRIYAEGRYEPARWGGLFETGSILLRKRTALYRVEPDRLVLLGLLPSAGDTSYGGVVLHDGWLYASYYTSRVDRDYPWILGMLAASDIRIARLPLAELPALDAGAARAESY